MQYANVALRTLLAFGLLWASTRLLGKKHIDQLSPFDYITGITIGSLAANLITPGLPWRPLALAIALWTALNLALHGVALRGRTLHKVLNGEPTVLIENGRVLERALRIAKIDLMQLDGLLRLQGYFNLSEVEVAVLETNGKLSVLPKSQYRPVQPRDLGLSTEYEGLPTQVIHEGRPLTDHLRLLGLDGQWLDETLRQHGVTSMRNVFAAWLSTTGHLIIDPYHDRPS